MKQITSITLGALLAVSVLFSHTAQAGEQKTCKVKTNDIGTIVGRGPSSDAAFEDAATKCFDRRASLYRAKKGTNVDEDAGLVMIDTCANIKCG